MPHQFELQNPILLESENTCRYYRSMTPRPRTRRKSHPILRSIVEVASVMFLFYANLLMGEFTRANERGKTLSMALQDVFTLENFSIGLVCAGIGYAVFEFWRRKLAYFPELRPRESPKETAEEIPISAPDPVERLTPAP